MDRNACPDVPPGCPADPFTGKAPRCGTDPEDPNCSCECQSIECAGSVQGSDPAAIGNYRYPKWTCGANAARIEGYGHDDPFWTCNPRWADGFIQPTFIIAEPFLDHYLGMDSERIYFEINGSALARGFLGEIGCRDSALCTNPGCVNNPNCSFTYLNEFCQPETKCKYCEGAGQPVATGLGAMFFNWRKYICQQRTKDGTLPALDVIQNIDVTCNASRSTCQQGQNVPPNPVADPCDHLWLYSSEFNTDPRKIKDFMCGVPNSQDRELGIKIKLSKYEIPAGFDNAWLPWSTKYQPNPERNLSPPKSLFFFTSAHVFQKKW